MLTVTEAAAHHLLANNTSQLPKREYTSLLGKIKKARTTGSQRILEPTSPTAVEMGLTHEDGEDEEGVAVDDESEIFAGSEDEEVTPPASLMIAQVDVLAKFRQFQETMADKRYGLSQDNIVDLTEGSRFLSDLGSKTTMELRTFLLNGVDFPHALNWENEEVAPLERSTEAYCYCGEEFSAATIWRKNLDLDALTETQRRGHRVDGIIRWSPAWELGMLETSGAPLSEDRTKTAADHYKLARELRDTYAFTVRTLKHDHYRSPDPAKLVICGFQASGFKLHLRVLLRNQGLFWLVPTKTVMLPQGHLPNDAPASLDIKTTSATPAKANKQNQLYPGPFLYQIYPDSEKEDDDPPYDDPAYNTHESPDDDYDAECDGGDCIIVTLP
ncbi:hypothetical protein HDU86_008431 [Geranomyces michiganensis]|nr:hypothetical protein HDU86_008431 [Geranomyces michiganensis]